ncbi:MAG: 2-hydroxyacyl-CoA dehydratase family protein [Candidatus Bathyarchaeota archaeon]|nr:2-hydroxyacyl-CoA dehydratase family protein [Candidatus Bathyarchaeota archaeon]MDH5733490.1 2-hydroxyacyl-CoA dehydratase family protein [Candidatus Bathyarchaeota archaeon]
MTANGAVDKFRELFETRDAIAAEWKNRGKKTIGCISIYTPEEVIYAAESLPVGILGGTKSFAKANVYLPSFSCSFICGFLEKLLENEYRYLDLVTLPSLCDSIWGFYSIWKQISSNPEIYLLHYPSKRSGEAIKYFTKEVEKFKNFLEKFTGKEISKKALEIAVDVYNENRRLLKRLYMLRKSESPPIFGFEALEVVLSSMTTPKTLHNELLKELLTDLAARQEYPEGEVRLLISGHILDNTDILRVVEGAGGLVVADDLDSGSRYFWSLVENTHNPIENVSQRYLNLPSPYGPNVKGRIKHLTDMIKEFNVEGVVFLTRRFCDPYLFDHPILEQVLKQLGVPFLHLEHAYPLAKASLRTRVEAFIEMLR